MTVEKSLPDGTMRIYRSKLIDSDVYYHGFPERTGGVSTGLRASLNLGYRWGDDLALVEANRRIVAEHVGYDHSKLVVTQHVHGTDVWTVGEELPDPPQFDGLVSAEPEVILGAFAADCVPMLFADPDARICAAAHAGWRGTVNGIGAKVVEKMLAIGASASSIRIALGPSIGPCCFEVGGEVVEEFRDKLGEIPGMVVAGPRKDHIDLRVAHIAVLAACGVKADQIDADPPCTRCNPSRFFSYRRDGRQGGVHMGFIGLRTR